MLGTLALTGAAVILLATARGIGLMPDSADYFSATENLLAGKGLVVSGTAGASRPFTLWPPLYPFLLALGSLAGLSLVEACRWLAALSFGGGVFLIGLATRRYTGSAVASLLAAALALCSASLLQVYSWAQTDGLFIMLALAGLLLLDRYRGTDQRRLLWAAALVCGISCLARYSGVSLVLTGTVVLLWRSRPERKRLLDAGIFALFALTPLVVWLARIAALTGSATTRDLLFHAIPSWKWMTGLDTLASWLVTYQAASVVKYVIGIGVLLVIAALAFLRVHLGRTGEEPHPAPFAPAVFIPCYLLTVVASITFLDAFIPLDNRLLSPLLPVAVVLVISLGRSALRHRTRRRFLRPLLLALGAAWFLLWATQAGRWTVQRSKDGEWYTGARWRKSETMAEVRKLPEDAVVYSNVPEGIYLVTGRPASPVPEVVDHHTGKDNPDYRTEMEAMGEALAGENAVVAYFTSEEERRWYMPSMRELGTALNLIPLIITADGALCYRIQGLTGSPPVLPD